MQLFVFLANFAGHGRAIGFLIVAGVILLLMLLACFVGGSSSESGK
jgi:hypothetical protein